ncbi:glycosyl transferase [Acrocarpospora corrugata]|uniref:Glycosyl transferase n=1 Tax=Acrocarpospora corrugata TaxID=35763 RepID=A0A5M3W4J8_9ACTN|nr:glycosyltransferase [Acrocarpospora corrugata]GES03987.1 glycosyl transferase [Acrocarpospora corrugata]
MKCSVVIPTYNREELLRHTLNSLTRQTLPAGDFEVLIGDDGSSDGTKAVVDGFRDRLNLRYFFQEDLGHRAAQARNLGLAQASAEICVLMDSGVLASTTFLATHLATHEAADVPLAVCGYVYCFNLDNEDAILILKAIDFANPDATIAKLKRSGQWLDVREIFYARYGDDFADLPAPWLNYWTCNVSARTAQLHEIGMFDENFRRWGGEDIDLGYRLHRAGARFVLNRDATAIHVPHPKSFDGNNDQAAENYRYMARKYGTPIIDLLPRIGELNFFELNDIIRELGLPQCNDFVAAQRSQGQMSG